MATRCTRPSGPIDATFIVRRPWRYAVTSSSVIVIASRLLMSVVLGLQLGRRRAVVLAQRGLEVAHATGSHDLVDELDRHVLVGRAPRGHVGQVGEDGGPQP